MKKRNKYDREFKENAVKLSLQRDDISALAAELGVSKDLLHSWRSEYRSKGTERFPGKGNVAVSSDAKAQVALKKEYERLLKENAILKKALGIRDILNN